MELLAGGGGGGLGGHYGSSHNVDGRSISHSRASTPTMKVRTQIVSKAPLPMHNQSGSLRGSLVGTRDAPTVHLRGMSSSLVIQEHAQHS